MAATPATFARDSVASTVYAPPGTRYQGQPLDVSSRRSLEIISLSSCGVAIATHDMTVTVDYFYHDGAFWQAIIPLDGVAEVYGQAFNFSRPRTRRTAAGPEILYDRHGVPRRVLPCLNHVQSRFVMKPDMPIKLYARGSAPGVPTATPNAAASAQPEVAEPEAAEPVCELHDFVYSTEAVGPMGVNFNLRDALFGNLVTAHRFCSTREMVFERIVVENQYVLQSPPLPLTDPEKRALLCDSLRRSNRARMHEVYFLLSVCGTNNCTSTPLQILDRVVEYDLLHRLGSFFYRLPLSPRRYLRIRGLDTDPSHRHLLRQEFADYIQDPATQQRKRTYVRERIRAVRAARKDAGAAEDK